MHTPKRPITPDVCLHPRSPHCTKELSVAAACRHTDAANLDPTAPLQPPRAWTSWMSCCKASCSDRALTMMAHESYRVTITTPVRHSSDPAILAHVVRSRVVQVLVLVGPRTCGSTPRSQGAYAPCRDDAARAAQSRHRLLYRNFGGNGRNTGAGDLAVSPAGRDLAEISTERALRASAHAALPKPGQVTVLVAVRRTCQDPPDRTSQTRCRHNPPVWCQRCPLPCTNESTPDTGRPPVMLKAV